MALPYPIASSQTDAKSPIDQQLMDAIRLDLDYIDGIISQPQGGGAGLFNFRVNGPLKVIKSGLSKGFGKRLDGALVNGPTDLTKATLYLEKGGTHGKMRVDVYRTIALNHPIKKITAQFEGTTQSIGRVGSALSTQAVDKAASDISTQAITKPKGTLNIETIALMSDDRALISFSGTTLLDNDYEVGDYITINGTTDAHNEGEFQILNINYDGLPSVVITNAQAVEQTTPNGTGELSLYQFEYLASVDPNFTEGESVIMSGHTDSGNDGIKTIFKTNVGGNNIWCKYAGGTEQSGVAGSAQCTRFKYTFSSAPDTSIFEIGQKAYFSGHTDSNNDGKLLLVDVSSSNSQVIVSNIAGVVQAGSGGTMESLRWAYATQTDSSSGISVGDKVEFFGHDDSSNDGVFEIEIVNRGGTNNIEVYNENGVAQSGANGTHQTVFKVVWFYSDYSTSYVVNESKVLLENVGGSSFPVEELKVVEINRGGFTNYNIVIDAVDIDPSALIVGRVATESRSIFDVLPELVVAQDGVVRNLQYSSNGQIKSGIIDSQCMLVMDIIEVQEGEPMNLVLSLS